jgi:diguanylate cyclase (GGDEF)-like protein
MLFRSKNDIIRIEENQMTKKIPGCIFGVLLLFAAVYTGYGHRDTLIYGAWFFGIFAYMCSAVAVYCSPAALISPFYFILAFSFIPAAIFDLMYIASYAGIGLWLFARFFEIVLLICAAIFMNRKVNKKVLFYAYAFFGIISIFVIQYFRIFNTAADSEVWKKTTGTWAGAALFVLFLLFYMILKHKRGSFDKKTYIFIMLSIIFKLPGDLLYIFFHDSTGYMNAAAYVFTALSFYMLLRAILKASLVDPKAAIEKEHQGFKGYHKRLFKNIKIGVVVFRFSDDRASVCFEDINDYAEEYSGIIKETYLAGWIRTDLLGSILAEVVRYAAGDRRRDVLKVKIDQKDGYIKVQAYPYPGDAILAMFEDMTQNVRRERKIRFLVLHDDLTKLYNRNYIAEAQKILMDDTVYPAAVIVGDVNGLKAVNDIFGHSEGDRLLCETAQIIRNSVSTDDICIRYGGDEFLMISLNCDKKRAEDMILLIRERLHRSNVLDFTPNVSFGYSIMSEREDLNKHIDIADQMMYLKKNEDEMNIQKGILKSLLRTHRFKDIESEDHLGNVARISMLLGKSMDLSGEELDELDLISSLHDIGKINIAAEILKKQGALDEEEWEKVKKHSMDGYSMTESIKEFKGISKYILFHHEQWDGKGYPYGLKGDSIPILSRIIAVADAYDSMMRERPYRAKLNRENAIREIIRNRGRQFDPEIVDHFIKIAGTV